MGGTNDKFQQRREVAAVHYASLPAVPNAREVAEGKDEAEGVLRDEAVAKALRGGVSLRDAAIAVDAVFAVLRERDRQVAASVTGDGEALEGGLLESDVAKAQLAELAMRIVDSPKSKMRAGALFLACGGERQGIRNQSEWAAAQGVSREHVSNEVEGWQKHFKLPATSAQKSARARAAYKLTNGAMHKGDTTL